MWDRSNYQPIDDNESHPIDVHHPRSRAWHWILMEWRWSCCLWVQLWKEDQRLFSLRMIVSIRGWGNLKSKKIAEIVQIFYLKMLTKEMLKRANTCKVISNNNHIINIKENKGNTSRGSMNEERNVMRTWSETLLSKHWVKLLKWSSRRLLKAMKSMMNATNSIAWVNMDRVGLMYTSS